MSDSNRGDAGAVHAIRIGASYNPVAAGQSESPPPAREGRNVLDDLGRHPCRDRSIHRHPVLAGLHPEAHDRTAEGQRGGPAAAREVGRLRVRRGRGPKRGPRVRPTSAPQGHGRGREIGPWQGRATLGRASRAVPTASRLGWRPGMGLETAQRTGNQSFLDSFAVGRPKVVAVGCGGAGGNSVHRLHRMGIHGARTVVVNTDAVHLDSIKADRKLLIGGGVTRGMGAGGRPEIGERCAEIAEQELRNQIGDADLTFITVGLGGGTGTGVAPHVAELAQAAGSVVISLATTPFRAERGRMVNARAGIQRLRDRTDSLILLDNNRLLDLVPNLPVDQAFAVMDHLIGEVIKGITESITAPRLINLDFSDVRWWMRCANPCRSQTSSRIAHPGRRLRTSSLGRIDGAKDHAAGGGGSRTWGAESSSIARVRSLGFIRTRIVSGFGLIMFQPARVIAPPTIVRTTYMPNVRNVIATGWRMPLRSKLRLRPAVGSPTLSPDRA